MAAFFGLLVLGLFSLLILYAEGALKEKKVFLLSLLLIACAMLIRGLCMDHETLDYQNFLTVWVDYFRKNGWEGLSRSVGNYNLPYLYFLALFARSEVSELYLIKLLSIFFDIILAWGVMRLSYLFTHELKRVLAAFFLCLFLPTVILNGAYWGQCDSIYTAFAVWSIYFALNDKPLFSVISIALSFAFKLQAVFIMPVFLVFIFAGKMKWWHLGAFPVTYFITALPAIAAGRPVKDAILLYFNQAGSVGGGLNYNSPSVFAFAQGELNTKLYSTIGIVLAFLFLFAIFGFCYVNRRDLSRHSLLACTLLICVGVPFLLPHMHDRYFFIADVMSLLFAFVVPLFSFAPLCVSFASLLGYHAYLRMRYLLPMRYGSIALLVVIFSVIIYMCWSVGKKGKITS